MRHQLACLCVALFIVICPKSPAAAPNPLCPTDGIVNGEQLADLVDCLADGLATVWEEDIKPFAEIAFPEIDSLKKVPLVHDESCNWRPEVREAGNNLQIRYGKTLIYFSLALQQAQFFYLMGIEPIDSPEVIFDYFDHHLLPVMRDDASKCRRSGPNKRGYPRNAVPSILNGRISEAQYVDLIEQLRRSPKADALQAYVGVFPMFFAVLHEAGHITLHAHQNKHLPEHEPEADDFARRVSIAGEIPVVLGLGHFQLFYGNNRRQHDAMIGCRLSTLARNSVTPRSFATEFGRDIWQRAEKLRDAYVLHYGALCTR